MMQSRAPESNTAPCAGIPLKVCFVLEHFYPHVGGVETEFWEFSRNLVALGHQVRVITSTSGGLEGHHDLSGILVWCYPWKGLFGHPYPRYSDLREHVKWADIVHTTTYTAAPVALRAAKAVGKKCVLSVQEALGTKWFHIGESPLTATLFYLFERFVVTRRFDAWHSISEATARDVRSCGVPSDRIHPILLGIDEVVYAWPHAAANPAELFGVAPSNRTILFFGRPGKTKGVGVLIDAIRMLRAEIPDDVTFGLILGAHPQGERERYVRQIRQEGLDTIVKVSPSVPREQLLSFVRGAYCVVVPSITEGFGFSAAETCALGTPIVASDGGSLPEVVSGKHLFFTNRSSSDLAAKLQQAIRGEFQYREQWRFSWSCATEGLVRLYRHLLQ